MGCLCLLPILRGCSRDPCSLGLLEPLTKAERLAKKFEDVRAVRQPVQQGRGQMVLPHHGIPLPEFEVGSNDDGTAFVERRAELEEEVGPFTAEGNEAKLIQDQQLLLAEQRQETREFQFVLG